jgi:hypothetical protein
MEDRLKLAPGQSLKLEGRREKGTMGQTEIYTYAVINSAGENVGSVVYTDHTALRGLGRTQSVVQKDTSGQVLVDVSW